MAIDELLAKFAGREGMAAVATDLGDRCRRLYGRSDQARRLYEEVVKRRPACGTLRERVAAGAPCGRWEDWSLTGGGDCGKLKKSSLGSQVCRGVGSIAWDREHS